MRELAEPASSPVKSASPAIFQPPPPPTAYRLLRRTIIIIASTVLLAVTISGIIVPRYRQPRERAARPPGCDRRRSLHQITTTIHRQKRRPALHLAKTCLPFCPFHFAWGDFRDQASTAWQGRARQCREPRERQHNVRPETVERTTHHHHPPPFPPPAFALYPMACGIISRDLGSPRYFACAWMFHG